MPDMSDYEVKICSCPEGPYYGAQMMGTVTKCERCGFITQSQLDALLVRFAKTGSPAVCEQETFVSREFLEDENGEWTRERAVIAECNGAIADDCGWKHVLLYMTGFNDEWFITSRDMQLLDAAHRAGVPITEENGNRYIL